MTIKKINLLQVLPSLNGGGVERCTIDTYEYFENTYVASEGGTLCSEIKDGFHITIPSISSKNPIKWIANALELIKLIKKLNINLIHVRSRAPAYSVFLACLITKTPWIATYHGNYRSQNYLKKLYNKIMLRGKFVISHSKFIHSGLEEKYPNQCRKKSVLIYEGIDTKNFDPINVNKSQIISQRDEWEVNNEKVILIPGRFGKGKGHEILIKSLKLLKENGYERDFKLICVGKSTSYLKDYFTEISKGINIKVLDSCEDMKVAYASCDIVVAPATHGEAFGRVCAEAMAMKKIFIGTNIGATPEIVKGVFDKFLVEPGYPCMLSEKIKEAMELSKDDEIYLGDKARKRIVENFSLEKMMEQTKEIYEKSIK